MRHNDFFIFYALRTKTYYIAVIIQSDPDYAIKTTFNENVSIYDKKKHYGLLYNIITSFLSVNQEQREYVLP